MVPNVAGSNPVDRPPFPLRSDVSTLEAIILGIIQGLTEFLPVSSSGHLILFQALFGYDQLDQYILFNLICHLGTLLAVCWFFFDKIKVLILSDRSGAKKLLLATLPLFPLVFFLKPLKILYQPEFLGLFFLTTAFLLYLGIRFGQRTSDLSLQKRKWKDPLIIGCFQAVAVLPGISRSGSTISAAQILGWGTQEAITFSFLLSIPTILGATALEVMHLWKFPADILSQVSILQYVAGFFTSLITGSFALFLIQRLAVKQKFLYFVWYCLVLGIFTLIYFNYG